MATQVSYVQVNVTVVKNIENQFWFNNFSLLKPSDTILGLWVAYINRQLGIAIPVFVIEVNVIVAKNRKSGSAQYLEIA